MVCASTLSCLAGEVRVNNMHLEYKVLRDWPKLAWVAVLCDGADLVTTLCGPKVEVGPEYVVEAVWAGSFEKGDFDRTDLVFGSGVRLRDDHVVFVSSGTTVDRLAYCRRGDKLIVSNSVPALLAITGQSLRGDYTRYAEDVRSIIQGPSRCVRVWPADNGDIQVVYFDNLVAEEGTVREVPKADTAPAFVEYAAYREYLRNSAERLGDNARAAGRRWPVSLVATVSSGYDSAAASVVSQWAGCTESMTIRQSASYWRGSDSGRAVARALGMRCCEYDRTTSSDMPEETIWAATGRAGDLNLAGLDYPEPLALLFTGFHGDKFWEPKAKRYLDPLQRGDMSGLGLCEFRLWKGLLHCPVPFWGARHRQELQSLSGSGEMAPWSVGNDYDRPVPRRIVEERGVIRTMFGIRKRVTVCDTAFLWPHSARAQHSWNEFRGTTSRLLRSGITIRAIRWIGQLENLVYRNILSRWRVRKRFRPWRHLSDGSVLFRWANHVLKREYARGLSADGADLAGETGTAK